ncbi:MAG: copper chaperone PCu(A)C [Mesorhizobium sp.]|nr:copper chaperone PCu(A)C [bacterium M00.F.Ca.ET.205.01.1.1]TGU55827.1 copper chaperone PCu(A)C [bacterium M00.F.Ca.ET.152.01.1.1]TGV39901.1 copper chaperone PCu(A)C [Mesorhizobium sp. M00.F.Ca.ET.186.01.1.1]TGZ44882.1 copper chaperone PCu(A)C [bacterium M00.F.Ca.ET.162.01.1.1]TIW61150.1 MAG: copper chaperone PCu(A)C [Mesorhizobium sp.]
MSYSPFTPAHSMPGRANSVPRGFASWFGIVVLALVLMLAGARTVLAHEFKVGDLEIEHPWSRATPAGAKVAGGYFTITNEGSAADRLLSISSDVSEKAELHEMGVKDGVMTMRPVVGGLEIPAGGKVALAPGGYHLMFMGLKRQPKQGEKFAATLTFEKAGTVTIEFAVEGMGEMGGTDDHAN